jgi:hypothetical protein
MKNAKNVGQTYDEHPTNATVEPTCNVTSDYKKEKFSLWLYHDTKAKIEELTRLTTVRVVLSSSKRQ